MATTFDDDDRPGTRTIAQLEDEIEALAQALERCRKLSLFAQVLVAGGALWLLAALVGFVRFEGAGLLAALAALIGGVVLAGSNRSTAQQTEARLAEAERQRAAMIGTLDLRVIDGGAPRLVPEDARRLQ